MPEWPIKAEEAFDIWMRLRSRGLRDLQRLLERSHKVKIPLSVLNKWREDGQWVEKSLQIDLLAEAEINEEAFQTLRARMVTRRADTMEIIGRAYDKLLRKTAQMLDADEFEWFYSKGASPDVLLKSINALQKLGMLYQNMQPAHYDPEADERGEDVDGMVDGPLDPLTLAAQLTAVAKRRPLIELRAEAEKE